MTDMTSLICLACERRVLKKVIFSKPANQAELRTVLTPREIGGKLCLQAESFLKDNKAKHENISLDDSERIKSFANAHGQINLITSLGECEQRTSKSGKVVLLGSEKLTRALNLPTEAEKIVAVESNNRDKNHILSGNEPFLKLLDVSDANGRIRDKKQAKFRQINRFLELIRDCLSSLPAEGELRICDLCCGKSYLSFAAYHYFANMLGRTVRMTGVDLKPDVIEHCNRAARELGFSGLEFLCGDVSNYDAGGHVNLVISLHACDIATDLVLERAVRWGADVILSTPCCHHELNHSLDCPTLSFISDHSMLRQKLCDAATDALRLKYLEAKGYAVCALELIDPEETPKNIMLRGLRKKDFRADGPAAKLAMDQYLAAKRFLVGEQGHVQELLCKTEKE